jgi:hypothetical protein
VVTCGVLLYLYYGIGESFQEKNVDTLSGQREKFTGMTVSGTLDSTPSRFEEEFYADLSDLFDANENFYQEIQGEYGFTP